MTGRPWTAAILLAMVVSGCQNMPRAVLSQYYRALGKARLNAGEYHAAAADFTQAIRWGGCNGDLYYERGLANFARDSAQVAIEDFNTALRCTPALEVFARARGLIYTMRGLTLLEVGGSAKALIDADSAVALDSTLVLARLVRGRARVATGAPELAITDFDFLLVRDTLRSEALYYLALAYRQSGQSAVALSVLRRLTQGDPKDFYVMKAKDDLRSMKAPR